jgi:hypothetical protein
MCYFNLAELQEYTSNPGFYGPANTVVLALDTTRPSLVGSANLATLLFSANTVAQPDTIVEPLAVPEV